MKVNALKKDYIIDSRIKYSNDKKESIVWFLKDTLKPHIETRQILTSGKVSAAYNRRYMGNGDIFETFQTPKAILKVYKDKANNIKKMLMQNSYDKKEIPANKDFIESFKSALKFVNKDLFSNI